MVITRNRLTLAVAAFVAAVTLSLSVQARDDPPDDPTPPSRDELMVEIDKALPEIIEDDNSRLVGALMAARRGKPLSATFSVHEAIRTLFGRVRPNFSPGCRLLTTPSGDPDPGNCTASVGIQAGGGAYSRLVFAKNMGFGNVKYQRRSADRIIRPEDLKAVGIGDREAYEKALVFLNHTFGLDLSEVPVPPEDAKNPYPIRQLALGWKDDSGNKGSVATHKVVMLRRGLKTEIRELPWVPAPGDAMVMLDDSGIEQAAIRNWMELREHPNISPGDAKSRSQLVEDIADELLPAVQSPVAVLTTGIVLDAIPEGSRGLMVPAVKVFMSPVPRDLSEEEQEKLGPSTTGVIMVIPLVDIPEGARDD